jgi:hypothetical protein
MGSSRKIQYRESDFNIFYYDALLNDVKYETFLGITIYNCLSWCQQMHNIVSKISSRLGLMCLFRTYLPTEGLIMYYNGYILPLVGYCCTVWGETTNLNLEKLCILIQKRAARIILNAKYDIPSLQLFKKKRGWLSIQNRLEYHKSVLMYKCINNSAPDYLCNLFDMNTNSNVYSLRSSQDQILIL